MIRVVVNIIKYYPVVMNIYLLIAMGLYLLDIDINISKYIYTILGQSFITNIILYYLSVKFKLCEWHRILIINMTLCLLLETLHNWNLLDWDYSYLTILTTILTSLIALLWAKIKKIYQKC